MTPVEIALLYLAVALAVAACLLAGRAYGVARQARWQAQAAAVRIGQATTTATEPPKPAEPSREERIAWARGEIEACRGAELALAEHASEVGPALMLAQYRANAARARQALRLLGVES